jgi:hypothetical protein
LRRAAVLVGAITVAALLLLGVALAVYKATDDNGGPDSLVVDEQQGSYRGVELGDSREDAEDALGEAASWTGDDPLGPLEPGWQRGAPRGALIVGTLDALRYPRAAMHLANGEVVEMIVAEPEAKTTRDVGVGDPLAAVRRAYPDLPCGMVRSGQAGRAPYCGGQIAGNRWLWFGGDPVGSITLASVRIG